MCISTHVDAHTEKHTKPYGFNIMTEKHFWVASVFQEGASLKGNVKIDAQF